MLRRARSQRPAARLRVLRGRVGATIGGQALDRKQEIKTWGSIRPSNFSVRHGSQCAGRQLDWTATATRESSMLKSWRQIGDTAVDVVGLARDFWGELNVEAPFRHSS